MFDLHFHSNCSDGKLSIADLAVLVRELKLKFCALTDHDTVAGIGEMQELLGGSGTTLITGAELTALYRGNEVHVLAYDLDVEAAAAVLKERNDLVWQQKGREMAEVVSLFRSAGFEVSEGLEPSPKKPVGLTVALDVYNNPVNQARFVERHGRLLDHQEFFDAYQAEGKGCATKRSGVEFGWLVGKFKGIAKDLIIAHPFVPVSFFVKPLNERDILDLIDQGATGVEVYHDKTSPGQVELLKRFVGERHLHFTGGSDFHGKKTDVPLGHCGPDTAIPEFSLAGHSYRL
ncbi:PHP domain-containing protein [Candidatus Uhrbacteria bacterium]|nr:PHP domain-containing protein [Candidatus Uhrbacteria bacterium]